MLMRQLSLRLRRTQLRTMYYYCKQTPMNLLGLHSDTKNRIFTINSHTRMRSSSNINKIVCIVFFSMLQEWTNCRSTNLCPDTNVRGRWEKCRGSYRTGANIGIVGIWEATKQPIRRSSGAITPTKSSQRTQCGHSEEWKLRSGHTATCERIKSGPMVTVRAGQKKCESSQNDWFGIGAYRCEKYWIHLKSVNYTVLRFSYFLSS